jgi:phosphatidylglycerol:prolipoprotein diacylglycerol transferase
MLQLGPLTIHAFGVCVALAMLWGTSAAERGFRRDGLDVGVGNRLGVWTLVGGFLGAHLFSILFYVPDKLRADPWLLLRVWEEISSFGGMLGGVIGALLFFRLGASQPVFLRKYDYLGVVARVFPASLAIGRLGCALAHDHPGTTTAFPLAISAQSDAARAFITTAYADAGRVAVLQPERAAPSGFHDLGWYEFLFLALVVVPLFQLWQRRDRPGGFYLIAFPLVYLPVRFGFDFLRIVDVRYAGLTPAQWVAGLTFVVLSVFAMLQRRLLRAGGTR